MIFIAGISDQATYMGPPGVCAGSAAGFTIALWGLPAASLPSSSGGLLSVYSLAQSRGWRMYYEITPDGIPSVVAELSLQGGAFLTLRSEIFSFLEQQLLVVLSVAPAGDLSTISINGVRVAEATMPAPFQPAANARLSLGAIGGYPVQPGGGHYFGAIGFLNRAIEREDIEANAFLVQQARRMLFESNYGRGEDSITYWDNAWDGISLLDAGVDAAEFAWRPVEFSGDISLERVGSGELTFIEVASENWSQPFFEKPGPGLQDVYEQGQSIEVSATLGPVTVLGDGLDAPPGPLLALDATGLAAAGPAMTVLQHDSVSSDNQAIRLDTSQHATVPARIAGAAGVPGLNAAGVSMVVSGGAGAANGSGGSVSVLAGAAGGAMGQAGGNLVLAAGAGTPAAAGGSVTVTAGSTADNAVPGNVTVTAGSGTNQQGGAATLQAGNATQNGGSVNLEVGTGNMNAGTVAFRRRGGTADYLYNGESRHFAANGVLGTFRVAVVTTPQRNMMTGQAGLLVYNTTTATLQVHNGATWVNV